MFDLTDIWAVVMVLFVNTLFILYIVILREDITVDQFIDVIEGNRAYIPVLYVFNKIDALTIEELDILDQMPNYVPISSQHGWNIEELMESVWDR